MGVHEFLTFEILPKFVKKQFSSRDDPEFFSHCKQKIQVESRRGNQVHIHTQLYYLPFRQ